MPAKRGETGRKTYSSVRTFRIDTLPARIAPSDIIGDMIVAKTKGVLYLDQDFVW